ncbi:hypothetical protein GOBAR_DD22193 [Gossypium barbadense]|nr:hypothetical protein GOBAR_DD22193 [Gossypium barbadense]
MASPFTPGTGRALSITPGSRVSKSSLGDETIWKRLKEAGFDEESIKKRDKAALIAYIAKLEAELSDHQHHMGLLTLEREELASKYEEIKASAEATELMHKRDQAAHISALAEAKKREDGLKKALGVEKECLASIEKALHEMRTESAETKVAAESRLAEARIMIEDAEKKFSEAETKFRAAKSLQTEATFIQRDAKRKLQEVEAREDDLSRQIVLFKKDSDAKEKEINLERQSLSERKKIVQQEHERLLDGQASLNQREEHIFNRMEELNCLEKELEASKAELEKERRALKDDKSNLELTLVSLSKREEAVIEREALLSKKEQELLVSQEKLANKESSEFRKVIASHENALRTRNSEFEAELELKRRMVEDEIEMKRRAWELKEMDINNKEDQICEREHGLDVRLRILAEKEKDVAEKSNLIDEELDLVRAQKLELMADVDRLEVERAKFETEWELIDEKREELRKEAVRVCKDREEISKYLKDERDRLRSVRDVMQEQHNKDVESLNREREDFMKKMVTEHSDWFNKIQQERADFLLGIETQKRELENCIEKRREELESSLKEREEAFEREKKNQLDHISALKEIAEKELEQATLEMKRLDAERTEIKLDRERREHEWAELNKSIEELKVQRHKLKQQRELLHADRKEIHFDIEELKKLGDLKAALDNMTVAQMQRSIVELSQLKASERNNLKQQAVLQNVESGSDKNKIFAVNGNGFNSPMAKPDSSPSGSARFSWIKRCSELIFKHTPDKAQMKPEERPLELDGEPKTLEVPSEGEVFERTHAGRKRRVDNMPSNGTKKSRQKEASVLEVEDNTHRSLFFTITFVPFSVYIQFEPNVVLDQPELMSYNQSEGGADETNELIVDRVINISEAIHVKETVDDFSNVENIDQLQDTGEKDKSGEPLVVPMGNVSQLTIPCQRTEDKSGKGKQKLEDNVTVQPDDKVRTRSRAGLKQVL